MDIVYKSIDSGLSMHIVFAAFKMNAHQRFLNVLEKRFQLSAQILGQNILSPQYRITWLTILMLGVLAFVGYQCIYTIRTAEIDLAVNAIADLCVDIKVNRECMQSSYEHYYIEFHFHFQFAQKSFMLIYMSKKYVKAIKFLESIYMANERTDANAVIIEKFVNKLEFVTKMLFYQIVITVICTIFLPLALYPLTGQWNMVLPMAIDGLDYRTATGFAWTWAIHVPIIIIAGNYFVCYDILFLILVVHVHFMTAIMSNKIQYLNQMTMEKMSARHNIQMNFRNILMLHQEIKS